MKRRSWSSLTVASYTGLYGMGIVVEVGERVNVTPDCCNHDKHTGMSVRRLDRLTLQLM
jgi:hypothetical protein